MSRAHRLRAPRALLNFPDRLSLDMRIHCAAGGAMQLQSPLRCVRCRGPGILLGDCDILLRSQRIVCRTWLRVLHLASMADLSLSAHRFMEPRNADLHGPRTHPKSLPVTENGCGSSAAVA